MGLFFWPDHNNGATFGVETHYLRNGWMYSADLFLFSEINLTNSGEDTYQHIGLMAGKYYGDRLFRVQLQGGCAAIRGTDRSDPSDRGFFTAGLVLKTGFKYIPFHFFGIGLDLQTNLNVKKPLYMPLISIEFGKLRGKIN